MKKFFLAFMLGLVSVAFSANQESLEIENLQLTPFSSNLSNYFKIDSYQSYSGGEYSAGVDVTGIKPLLDNLANEISSGGTSFYDDAVAGMLLPDSEWSIEELGDIIVASGDFWNDWWLRQNNFGWEHTYPHVHLHSKNHPEHIYVRLLPSSGFTSLEDIRQRLSLYYTERFIDEILGAWQAPFVEYANNLYILDARIGAGRTNWDTAIHTLIEADENSIVVRTSAIGGAWEMNFAPPYFRSREEVTQLKNFLMDVSPNFDEAQFATKFYDLDHYITFIDGKIDNKELELGNTDFIWTAFGFLPRFSWFFITPPN